MPVFGVLDSKIYYDETWIVEAHAGLYWTYSMPAVRGFLARLGQLADTFGVKLDLGIAWDAVTLTFVVDWFINVSEYLHTHVSRDWTKLEVILLDFFRSGRVEKQMNLNWWRPAPTSSGSIVSLLANRTISYYDRDSAEMPEFKSVDIEVNGDPWKINRVINASALTVQKSIKNDAGTPLWFNYRAIQRKKARKFKSKFKLM
jgi:hypothetical protein